MINRTEQITLNQIEQDSILSNPGDFVAQIQDLFQPLIQNKKDFDQNEAIKKQEAIQTLNEEIQQHQDSIQEYQNILKKNNLLNNIIKEIRTEQEELRNENSALKLKHLTLVFADKLPRVFQQLSTQNTQKKVLIYDQNTQKLQNLENSYVTYVNEKIQVENEARTIKSYKLQQTQERLSALQKELEKKESEKTPNYFSTLPEGTKSLISLQINRIMVDYRTNYAQHTHEQVTQLINDNNLDKSLSQEIVNTLINISVDSTLLSICSRLHTFLDSQLGETFGIRQNTNLIQNITQQTVQTQESFTERELLKKQDVIQTTLPSFFDSELGNQNFFEKAILEEIKQEIGPSKTGFANIYTRKLEKISTVFELIHDQENKKELIDYLYQHFTALQEYPDNAVKLWLSLSTNIQHTILEHISNSEYLNKLHITTQIISSIGSENSSNILYDIVNQQYNQGIFLTNKTILLKDSFIFELLTVDKSNIIVPLIETNFFAENSNFTFELEQKATILFVYLVKKLFNRDYLSNIPINSLVDCFDFDADNNLFLTKTGTQHPQVIELVRILDSINYEQEKSPNLGISVLTQLPTELPQDKANLIIELSRVLYLKPGNLQKIIEENPHDLRFDNNNIFLTDTFITKLINDQEYNKNESIIDLFKKCLIHKESNLFIDKSAFKKINNPSHPWFFMMIETVIKFNSKLFETDEFRSNPNSFFSIVLNENNKVQVTLKEKMFTFTDKIKKPFIGSKEINILTELLKSGYVTNESFLEEQINKLKLIVKENREKKSNLFSPLIDFLDKNLQNDLINTWTIQSDGKLTSPQNRLFYHNNTLSVNKNLPSSSTEFKLLYQFWQNRMELVDKIKLENNTQNTEVNPFLVFRIHHALAELSKENGDEYEPDVGLVSNICNKEIFSINEANGKINITGDHQSFQKLLSKYNNILPLFLQTDNLKNKNVFIDFPIPKNPEQYIDLPWRVREIVTFSDNLDKKPKLKSQNAFRQMLNMNISDGITAELTAYDYGETEIEKFAFLLQDYLNSKLEFDEPELRNYLALIFRMTQEHMKTESSSALNFVEQLRNPNTYHLLKDYLQCTIDSNGKVIALLTENVYATNDILALHFFHKLALNPVKTNFLTFEISAENENMHVTIAQLIKQSSQFSDLNNSYFADFIKNLYQKTQSFDTVSSFIETFKGSENALFASTQTLQLIKTQLKEKSLDINIFIRLLKEMQETNILNFNTIADMPPEKSNFWYFMLQTGEATEFADAFITTEGEPDIEKFLSIITPKLNKETGRLLYEVSADKLLKFFKISSRTALELVKNNSLEFDETELFIYMVRNYSSVDGRLLEYFDITSEITPNVLTQLGVNKEKSAQLVLVLSKEKAIDTDNLYRFLSRILNQNYSQKELETLVLMITTSPKMLDFQMQNILFENLHEVSKLSDEKVTQYIELSEKIDNTPSLDIQKIKYELIQQLIQEENPLLLYQKIESIFLKNNLPIVGKILKIFEILYPDEKITEKLSKKGHHNLSPIINKSSARRRRYIFYEDLIKIHIDSNNSSLKNYLEVIKEGSDLSQRIENGETLSESEAKKLHNFIAKTQTLHTSSTLGKNQPHVFTTQEATIDALTEIKKELGVKKGQSIEARVTEMFLYPIGVKNIDDALTRMENSRKRTTERNRIATQENPTIQNFSQGDLIKGILTTELIQKGVGFTYLRNILQNGSVAKDFLGSGSDSDETPFDTDALQITQDDSEKTFEEAFTQIHDTQLKHYGQLLFVTKDRGQFQRSDELENPQYQRESLELFKTGVVDSERHIGVRTGLPSSEIDYFIVHENLQRDRRDIEKICFIFAEQNTYYPIYNHKGELLFSHDDFLELRKAYNGIESYDGNKLTITELQSDHPLFSEVSQTQEKITEGIEEVTQTNNAIREIIKNTLESFDITLKEKWDESLIGAELHDIGSTGRNTNMPGDFDFDYTLLLDYTDQERTKQIFNALKNQFQYDNLIPSESTEGHLQLRLSGVQIRDSKVDIDIGIGTKKEGNLFASHDATATKLAYIKKEYGEQAYLHTIANIILTKKLLKESHAYKKGNAQDGGFGGIGVENWILANNGNIDTAFQSFWDAAHQDGERISLSEFRKKYHIYDAGMNLKFDLKHDNFIDLLTEKGYEAMLKVIEKYLNI
jgi:hypothetical protein